jgi:hypothetical protein
MTTSHFESPHFDYHLNRPGTLIAAVPAVLGFVPERSLVVVTVRDGELGCVMRVDLSEALLGSVGQLADVAAAAEPDEAIAVIVDERGAACDSCGDAYRELAQVLQEALADQGITLLAAHVVDRIAAGGRWYCADGCGAGGAVDDPTSSPMAAAAVLDGRQLYRHRAELQAVVEADLERGTQMRPLVTRCAGERGERSDAAIREDVEGAIAAARRLADGDVPGDVELARLACALTDPPVRDTLYALAVGQEAAAAEALWALLARSLPAPWRVEALVLLAFSAYARGDGPLAGVALDAALRVHTGHRMAGMLDTALQSGLRPEQIRELAHTGYRLADRLGIALPPRHGIRRAG